MEIILFTPSGEELLTITPTESSYRDRKVAGDHSLTLYFSLDYFVDISVGCWCEFQTQIYTLESPENFKKLSSENFEYTLLLHPPQARLKKYKLRNPVDRRLKFSYTATPLEHLDMLINNLNEREVEENIDNPDEDDKESQRWKIGEYIRETEKVISYNHTSLDEALSMIAQEFETEWEIEGQTIHLRKVEHNKDYPLELSYGKGKGLLPNVGRQNKDSSNPIEILFVQGGDRNIDVSTYGNQELLLPKGQILEYEGRTYISDKDGCSIRRLDPDSHTGYEDSLDCSHIYPKRVGNVTRVEIPDEENNFYDIYDSTIKELNYNDYLLEGETMTIIFQSGMLAGKEFDVKYIHEDQHFEIVPQEIDGLIMPGGSYVPRAEDFNKNYEGDRYVVFGCTLPEEYICENEHCTGASWDMFRAAAKYLYENEEPRYSFICEVDGLWSKNNWQSLGIQIIPGGYVSLSDSQFQPEPIRIRIVGIKEYLHKPHSPILELSNLTVGGSLYSQLNKIDSNQVENYEKYKDSISLTKRRYRDSAESLRLLEEAFDNYNPGINPLWVRTMSMLVGDESLQFSLDFKNDPETPAGGFHYDQESREFTVGSCTLTHMTLNISSLSPLHKESDYRRWEMKRYFADVADDPEIPLYLYAICTKSEEDPTGKFLFSPHPYALEPEMDNENYYFLVGALNSEYAKERSFVTWYGYTEITPGRITLDSIRGTDDFQYWDFAKKSFRIGDKDTYFAYNLEGEETDKKLVLRGVMTQSPGGGDLIPLGIFRDEWKNDLRYYEGEEVTHEGSTYRCVLGNLGIEPGSNATYWKVLAQRGYDGNDGAPPASHVWEEGNTYYRNKDVVDYIYYQTEEQKKEYKAGTWWKVSDRYSQAVAGASPDPDIFKQVTSFSTIATNVVLANEANLAGFQFKDGKLRSQEYEEGKQGLELDGDGGIIKAFTGMIGGFNINTNGLTNTDGFSRDKAAYISMSSGDSSKSSSVKLGGDPTNLVNINTAERNQTGLYITANGNSKYAIHSTGSHVFKQRSTDSWDAPGVLWAGIVSVDETMKASYTRYWWTNTLTNISVSSRVDGFISVNHYLGHTNYVPIATAHLTSSLSGNFHTHSFPQIQDVGNNSFQIKFVNSDNGGAVAGACFLIIVGRN